MTWAGERRLIVLSILGAILVAFIVIILIATFYKSPTCTDGVRNQNEQGIDCGGSCSYLCTANEEPPTVLFTKAIPSGVGRLDVVALVENKNATAAAKDVPTPSPSTVSANRSYSESPVRSTCRLREACRSSCRALPQASRPSRHPFSLSMAPP